MEGEGCKFSGLKRISRSLVDYIINLIINNFLVCPNIFFIPICIITTGIISVVETVERDSKKPFWSTKENILLKKYILRNQVKIFRKRSETWKNSYSLYCQFSDIISQNFYLFFKSLTFYNICDINTPL